MNGHPLREQIKREVMNAMVQFSAGKGMAVTSGEATDKIIALFEPPARRRTALEDFMGVVG
jgi:hypothetical protein